MNPSLLGATVLLGCSVTLGMAGCGSKDAKDTDRRYSGAGDAGDGGAGDGGAGDGGAADQLQGGRGSVGQAGDSATSGSSGENGSGSGSGGAPVKPGSLSPFGFKVSNVPDDIALPTEPMDWVYYECCSPVFSTDTQEWSGVGAATHPTGSVIELEDGSEAVLIIVNSFETSATAKLFIAGHRPLIIAALDSIELNGTIDGSFWTDDTDGFRAGGPPGPVTRERSGLGPGAGKAGSATSASNIGGGGAGYCGKGGAGSNNASAGGQPYGSQKLVPLLPGSSGGTADFAGGVKRSSGGGAIQLVAGKKLVLAYSSVVSMLGLAGPESSGGGSGGAILLEAPDVKVQGVLSVNSGAGSGWHSGGDGTLTATPATCVDNSGSRGGTGSGGEIIDGSPGELTGGDYSKPAGGGGGAGRIRINSLLGEADIDASAVITPALTSECATQGSME